MDGVGGSVAGAVAGLLRGVVGVGKFRREVPLQGLRRLVTETAAEVTARHLR